MARLNPVDRVKQKALAAKVKRVEAIDLGIRWIEAIFTAAEKIGVAWTENDRQRKDAAIQQMRDACE